MDIASDTGNFPIRFVWLVPYDSAEQVGSVDVLARLSSFFGLKRSEILIDGKEVKAYESSFYSWGTNADYFLHFTLTDTHFDTGFHRIDITVTDSVGNTNSRPISIKLVRNLPDDFYAPETISVSEGWNLVSPVKYPAWARSDTYRFYSIIRYGVQHNLYWEDRGKPEQILMHPGCRDILLPVVMTSRSNPSLCVSRQKQHLELHLA
jgi:hypothetical protein